MEKVSRSLFQKVTSFVLVAAMVFSTMVAVRPQEVSAADMSLKASGGTVAITDENCTGMTGEVTWIKYTAKADGYLQLKFASNSQLVSYAAGSVILYDKNKSRYLSGRLDYDTSSTSAALTTEYYGVKKGSTYNIALLSTYGGVRVTVKFKKLTDKSGTKKSKALNLKKGKSTLGLVPSGSGKARWYKFTFTKDQKITFNVTPYMTGSLYLTLSGPGIFTKRFEIDANKFWGQKDSIYTKGKVKAGTYYVQIKPGTKACSGYYKVSWK